MKEHELYRNTLIFQTRIMSKEAFESVQYEFKTKPDPKTGEKIELSFSKADFKLVESEKAASALIKQAAYHRL